MYKAAFGPLFYYAKKGGLTTSDKLNSITALANDALSQSTDGYTEWASLLGTISRLYKYPFYDQLMIHAQRPGATACASYEVWNDTMRRYVRRGAKGIALVDNSGDAPRLRYVFDIADTGTRRSSRPFSPWEINDGNLAEVQLGLRQAFNAESEWLSSQLQDVARDLAEMYFDAHRHDIAGIVDGSLMAGYDEGELRDSFIKATYVSTAWAKTQPLPPDPERRGLYCSYVVDKAHPVLTDALVTHARRELEKKPSVMDKLQSAETPPRTAAKAAAPEL